MFSPQQLAEAFARNANIVKMQTDGLSTEESLLQPPFRGNCLNWVVGHIVQNRDRVIEALGGVRVFGSSGERYRRESEPITGDGEGILRLEELLALLEQSQQAIEGALKTATEEDLKREITPVRRPMPAQDWVFFLYFHDTYHTGQTELLRQLAGKGDKVI